MTKYPLRSLAALLLLSFSALSHSAPPAGAELLFDNKASLDTETKTAASKPSSATNPVIGAVDSMTKAIGQAMDPLTGLLKSSDTKKVSESKGGSESFFLGIGKKASEIVMTSMQFIGVKYTWGGDSVEEGFDCSGFTRHVFEEVLGLALPRNAAMQAKSQDLVAVKRNELQPGDLVFFRTRGRQPFSHVGIYIGEDKFVHAPRTGERIRVDSVSNRYWNQRFTGARRTPQMERVAFNDAGVSVR